MSKAHLIAVIKDHNFWPTISGKGTVISEDITELTQANADLLFNKIDGDLSPENLHCDGEASITHVRREYAKLNGAAAELRKMGFDAPAECYGIK